MMQNDNEPNTLAAHNVQVGDVVQPVGRGIYEVLPNKRLAIDYSRFGKWKCDEMFTVISRAKPKSEIETQFGDWKIWNGKGELPTGLVQIHRAECNRFQAEESAIGDYWEWGEDAGGTIIAFRCVIEPVRGEVVWYHGRYNAPADIEWDGDTHRITLPTTYGNLIPGKYTGPDGAVVTVEVL